MSLQHDSMTNPISIFCYFSNLFTNRNAYSLFLLLYIYHTSKTMSHKCNDTIYCLYLIENFILLIYTFKKLNYVQSI